MYLWCRGQMPRSSSPAPVQVSKGKKRQQPGKSEGRSPKPYSAVAICTKSQTLIPAISNGTTSEILVGN